jgi:hypothetical protein
MRGIRGMGRSVLAALALAGMIGLAAPAPAVAGAAGLGGE